jgi:hypothetical protein
MNTMTSGAENDLKQATQLVQKNGARLGYEQKIRSDCSWAMSAAKYSWVRSLPTGVNIVN